MFAEQTTPQSLHQPLYPPPQQTQQAQWTLPLPRSLALTFALIIVFVMLPAGCSVAGLSIGPNNPTPTPHTLRGVVTEFDIPTADANAQGIAAGPDGALWFTEQDADKIARITTDGKVTEYPIPTAGAYPHRIAKGPDGALWFTEYQARKIGRITPAGAITEYPIADGSPWDITAGPDGALWVTLQGEDKIARVTPKGAVTTFDTKGETPWAITAGADGNLWFTELNSQAIGRITPSGQTTDYPVHTTNTRLYGIAKGSDGDVYFTEQGDIGAASMLGKITPNGTIPEVTLQDVDGADAITASPDGNLWVTQDYSANLARVTPQGSTTQYLLGESGEPAITIGPDGNLWFTGDQIGRLS